MQAFLEKFFTDLGITITSLTVKEEAGDLSVRIETPDSPLLIGIHGRNIEAFQHYFARITEKKLGHFVHVHLEVNDYVKAKDDRLFAFLDGKIEWVMQSGKSTQIKNLSSFERKKAHSYISEKKIE
jgi:predicted RNA-binding protein Jag